MESATVRCWGYNGEVGFDGLAGYLGLGYGALGCREVDDEGHPVVACPRPECCIGDDEAIETIPPVEVF